jgi:hypothetical protein
LRTTVQFHEKSGLKINPHFPSQKYLTDREKTSLKLVHFCMMSKCDQLDSLPLELLFVVLNFALISEVSAFSETSKVLSSLCRLNFMPTVSKFCLKQQNKDYKGLIFWLNTSVCMDGLYLDNRIIIEKANDWNNCPLRDKHFTSKSLFNFSHLSTLVIRAGNNLTSKSFQNIAKCTGSLTTLGI